MAKNYAGEIQDYLNNKDYQKLYREGKQSNKVPVRTLKNLAYPLVLGYNTYGYINFALKPIDNCRYLRF